MCPAGLPSLHFFCIKVTDVHINRGEKVQHRSSFAPAARQTDCCIIESTDGTFGARSLFYQHRCRVGTLML